MSTSKAVETMVLAISETAISNESYFCELDAVAGDGDFGFSLARGFEVVLDTWEQLDRDSNAAFLRRIATIITSRTGGTSGPIWGTAFLRAAGSLADADATSGGPSDAAAALRASIKGIMDRGKATVGDKTLLDALVPAADALERAAAENLPLSLALERTAQAARAGAEATRDLEAKRGRASYTGARSVGSLDPGAVAVALMTEEIARRLVDFESIASASPTSEEPT
ncbi:dihydroxyacetone kinase subunit DhaL [Nocardioides sp. CER19]|uniref:dihydroxyacetone kinase subunit DhaL n=1 Tax=Nocardioides sp. CER19 TaxID=3038538 RepID=UPI00244768F1|nr:dihydroxyacetone kinase subunit DhaL [Nocardioides sp. CER19]MDH2416170.1 dihydroxyacetone kinase subunit DhaL [Nocardioides sp. CER19]